MSDLFWLTPAQLNRIKPHFPLSHGVPRSLRKIVNDLGALSEDSPEMAMLRKGR
jgi:hypothetical protein